MLCQLFLIFTITFSINIPAWSKSSSIVFLLQDQKGKIIVEKNSKERFNLASTLKLLTSLVALKTLGENYRFKTEFYLSNQNDLKIKGYGDPFLISEIWNKLAKKISNKVKTINNIFIDDSFFARHIKIPGIGSSLNPYDAPVGALCVNFNTFYVKKVRNKFVSAEPQTPLIPFVQAQIKKMHIKKTGRYVISHKIRVAEKYAGELFKYFLIAHGTKVKGKIGFDSVSPKDKLVYSYYSDLSLKEIVKKMMRYSNNFIANQIVLVLGAEFYGAPATMQKGLSVIKNYAREKLGLKDTTIVEGSGISRQNLISCRDMIIILRNFIPYMNLLKKKDNMYYKTGTLKGINTRAGYIIGKNNTYIFVVFLRGKPQTADHFLSYMSHCLSPFSFHNASFSPEDLMIR